MGNGAQAVHLVDSLRNLTLPRPTAGAGDTSAAKAELIDTEALELGVRLPWLARPRGGVLLPLSCTWTRVGIITAY